MAWTFVAVLYALGGLALSRVICDEDETFETLGVMATWPFIVIAVVISEIFDAGRVIVDRRKR